MTSPASPPVTAGRDRRAALSARFEGITTFVSPLLPRPARIGVTTLAAGAVLADLLTWLGNFGGGGISSGLRPVPILGALLITGCTVTAALLPRLVYAWLQKHDKWRDFETDGLFSSAFGLLAGTHLLLAGLIIAAVNQAHGAPSRNILANVVLACVVLWCIHEAVQAKRLYDRTRP